MTVKNIFDTREKNGLIGIYVGEGGHEELFLLSGGEYKRLPHPPSVGCEVGEDLYNSLAAAAERTKAVTLCAQALTSGDKSVGQLRQKLRQKGISKESAEHAILLMQKKGYLNEEESAKRIAAHLVSSKHYGRRRVLEYLYSHGYGKDASDTAAESVTEDEYSAALRYTLGRKYPDLAEMTADGKRKAVAALMRLGFTYDEIRRGMREN